jgi:hypothetical protein
MSLRNANLRPDEAARQSKRLSTLPAPATVPGHGSPASPTSPDDVTRQSKKAAPPSPKPTPRELGDSSRPSDGGSRLEKNSKNSKNSAGSEPSGEKNSRAEKNSRNTDQTASRSEKNSHAQSTSVSVASGGLGTDEFNGVVAKLAANSPTLLSINLRDEDLSDEQLIVLFQALEKNQFARSIDLDLASLSQPTAVKLFDLIGRNAGLTSRTSCASPALLG